MKKFNNLKEIEQAFKDLEHKKKESSIRLVNIIIRRTNDHSVIETLIKLGYNKKTATLGAKKLAKENLILTTTHLEHAELLVGKMHGTCLKPYISPC